MTFYNTVFSVYGFWFHQYIKSKILKRCFLLNEITDRYTMEQIGGNRDNNPHLYTHNIYVPQDYIAIFGETTRASNFLTKNCVEAFARYKINYKNKTIMEEVYNNRPIRLLDRKIVEQL